MADPAPLVGILLAAGNASRFGGNKLLHPLGDGQPLALAAARGLRQACDGVVAVVRPDDARLARILLEAGCAIVPRPPSSSGMGDSLAAGVRASPAAAGWIVALADMPAIAPATYHRIAAALRAGASIAAPSHQGRRGHPVGFARHWVHQLGALTGDTGARSLLAAHPERIQLCEVDDPGIFRDIDTSADLDAGWAPPLSG